MMLRERSNRGRSVLFIILFIIVQQLHNRKGDSALGEPVLKHRQIPLLIIPCDTAVTRLGKLMRFSPGLRGLQIEINIENNMS